MTHLPERDFGALCAFESLIVSGRGRKVVQSGNQHGSVSHRDANVSIWPRHPNAPEAAMKVALNMQITDTTPHPMEIARKCETLGFEAMLVNEHMVVPVNPKVRYYYGRPGDP